MPINSEKIYCEKKGCYKYIEVCKHCKHSTNCGIYSKYKQPLLFDIKSNGKKR